MSLAEIFSSEGEEKTREEIISEILEKLTNIDENKVKILTDLELTEVDNFAWLLTIAKIYDIEILKEFVNNTLLLRISKKRKGRQELLKAIQHLAIGTLKEDDTSKKSIIRRLLGV